MTAAIQARVRDAGASFPLWPAARAELTTLYEAGAYRPLWVDGSGRVTRDARDTLALLASAGKEGLDPTDYEVSSLESAATALDGALVPAVSSQAAFDTDLSARTLRFLYDLHMGRVDPRAIGFRMTTPRDEHDFAASLRSSLADHRVPELAARLAPPLTLYRELRSRLVRYRELAADRALQDVLPTQRAVHPGESCAGLAAVSRLLTALGDLPADAPRMATSSLYEGAVVDAVKRFQTRHGLDADGVLGVRTQKALQVPLAWRMRQIELALERLRWLPHLDRDRFLAVNIAMFRLSVWDSSPPDGPPSFGMGVIVGRALNRQTPVFAETMKYLIFRPYWNVPASIVRGEILPALRRDPGYLARKNMEIVSGSGDTIQVRQRPGPANSLGLVKFIFPNDDNVYLHDTPAPELFKQSRRDFSHGCVRVEDPTALAEWALKGQDGWDRERIVAAMNGSRTQQVDLARPIPVILFYITAVVREDGAIHFAEDIYGHDTRLDRALGQRGR